MMNKWSADSLIMGYERCIVGFDYRAWQNQIMMPATICDQYRTWIQDRGIFPATIYDQIWPCKHTKNSLLEEGRNGLNLYQEWPRRGAIQNSLLQENGVNLFYKLREKIKIEPQPRDSILVAFDFPVTLVNTVASMFGIFPLPLNLITSDKGWKFLGFDVADIRTLCSGFYGFDWTETEFSDMCTQQSLSLNGRGLIDDELFAIKSAIAFDLLVSEHAPFAPCGVWIAHSPVGCTEPQAMSNIRERHASYP
jgi:hypothetical protein